MVIRQFKRRAAGPDGLMAEHLQGGDSVAHWLTGILNAIMDLEAVPDAMKSGRVVPVHKGSGKDL